ncbi:MAG: hypothetical protein H7836_12345 [Magnetococcus sp. YQC-3]
MNRQNGKNDLGSLLKLMAPILVAIPAVTILLWTFYFTSSQLEQWARDSLGKIGNQVIEKTVNFLDSASFSADYNATWTATHENPKTFAADFHQIARKQMDHFPHFRLIYFGDRAGNHWLNKKDPDGQVRTRVIERLDDSPHSREQLLQANTLSETLPEEHAQRLKILAPILKTGWYAQGKEGLLQFSHWDPVKAYDPRLRPWYEGARQLQGKSWIDVYTWENKFQEKVEYEAGITVSYPVMRQGQLLGVVGIDLVLGAISDFLGQLHVSKQGRVFIFDSAGRVVGIPNQSSLLRTLPNQRSVERLRLHDLHDPAISAAYDALLDHLGAKERIQPGKTLGQFSAQIIRFAAGEEPFIGFFRPLDPSFPLDWHVGVLMPESDIKGEMEQQFRWVFIGIVAVVTLFLCLIPLHLKSEKERRWIQGAFAKYVSPNRVEYLLQNPGHLTLGGEYRECSFVMTDLKGFTSLMEQIGDTDPQKIVNTLNEYLEGMVGIAFRHEGTLDRIVGDAVAVLFSAPVPQEDHAQRAFACAMEMDQFATRFAMEQQQQGVPFGITRIGVNSGEVLLGNFGGKLVFDYRALGDSINTASRLESVNNQLGTRICISGETVSRITGFRGRPVGRLVLKGKEQGILAYQPITDAEHDPAMLQCYAAAYHRMAQGDPAALDAFAQAREQWPEDPLLRFHHQRLLAGQSGETIYFTDK